MKAQYTLYAARLVAMQALKSMEIYSDSNHDPPHIVFLSTYIR